MNQQFLGPVIETERLRLRRWQAGDLAPYAAINSDHEVMQTLLSTLTVEQTRAEIAVHEDNFERLGYGVWAVELRDTAEFIGSVGLEPYNYPTMVVVPTVAICWKLAHEFWGQGFAYEAASAVVDYAFKELGMNDVVALFERSNVRSVRLMQRLNMQLDKWDEPKHVSAKSIRGRPPFFVVAA
jgi:RimJ/RimL family protein N-acetyltransferase